MNKLTKTGFMKFKYLQ